MQSFNFQSRKNPIRINKKVTAPRSEKSNIGDRPWFGYYSESCEISARENDRRVISARITRICSGRPCAVRCSECDKTQMPIYLRRTVHHNSGQRACGPLPSSFRYRYSDDQHGLTNTRSVPMNFNRVHIRTRLADREIVITLEEVLFMVNVSSTFFEEMHMERMKTVTFLIFFLIRSFTRWLRSFFLLKNVCFKIFFNFP